MIRLSKRLQAVAHQVESHGVTADIGCDHGFTSIYLLEQGLADHVIAMDINEGPLQRAREHVTESGLTEQIELRLSDGAKMLIPGEADTLLISGMGGALICKILSDSPEVVKNAKELVLSPQSEWAVVRHYLHDHGFAIAGETMVLDQGKYYLILRAVPGQEHYSDETEYIYGRYLPERGDTCLISFLEKEEARLQGILNKMASRELSEQAAEQKQELEQELALVRRTKEICLHRKEG